MAKLEALRNKIASIEQLQSVVKTMKAMAAVNIRQYEAAVAALQTYYRTVDLGLRSLLIRDIQLRSEPKSSDKQKSVSIVFGSDQGMCGHFNEQIVAYAQRGSRDSDRNDAESVICAVGHRVIGLFERTGGIIEDKLSLPSSIHGITNRVRQLIELIEYWRVRSHVRQVMLFYNRYADSSYQPTERRLLPLDAAWIDRMKKNEWPTRALPAFRMDPDRLFSSLIREYLFVSLYRAFAESLAAENASRLRAMQAAEKNIQDRRSDLNMQFHRQRQSSITEQLLDVVTGYEAMKQ